MPQPIAQDLTLLYGSLFTATVTVYSDERLKTWRGTWSEWRVYEVGEGALWEGVPYVAVLATQHAEPGSAIGTAFWSPLKTFSMNGYSANFVVGEEEDFGFKIPADEAAAGAWLISVDPTLFADAPSSAPYHLELIDPTGNVEYSVSGTALFRRP